MIQINNQLRIVLVGTTHPGNIGAAARAMKTMAQSHLYLVSPKVFPSEVADSRATGAIDILTNATVVANLKDAVKDCDFVIGTSARPRRISVPVLTPRACAETISQQNYSSIAVVFGRESSGLNNAEIGACNRIINIPTNAEYSSLNLAAAVQIICYELFIASQSSSVNPHRQVPLADHSKMEHLYAHMEHYMTSIGFLDTNRTSRLMDKLRSLFNRSQLDEEEWRILSGLFTKSETK